MRGARGFEGNEANLFVLGAETVTRDVAPFKTEASLFSQISRKKENSKKRTFQSDESWLKSSNEGE